MVGVNYLFKGTQCEAGCRSTSWTPHAFNWLLWSAIPIQGHTYGTPWAATPRNQTCDLPAPTLYIWGRACAFMRSPYSNLAHSFMWAEFRRKKHLERECPRTGIFWRDLVWCLGFSVCTLISPCHSGLAMSPIWGLTPPDNSEHCVSSSLADYTGNINKLLLQYLENRFCEGKMWCPTGLHPPPPSVSFWLSGIISYFSGEDFWWNNLGS